MTTQTYQEISLSEIKVNPRNPRKGFEGQKFDQLVASIREKGVIEPIVVRRKGKGFEIVAGERRFRAQCQVNPESSIAAVVRELSEDEAFEFMIIENLQREDLTEMEEAQSFLLKAFLVALFLVTLVMVAEFNSLIQPLIIMSTVILSLSGVFLALVVFNMPFGVVMTGVACISLAGVVVNNGIVLIDFINKLRDAGSPVIDAVC